MNVVLPAGFVCPSASDFLMEVNTPRDRPGFTFTPKSFPGSEDGTTVGVSGFNFPSGSYRVDEFMPEISPGLALLLQPGPGGGVESREGQDIHPGETSRCTWVNEYRVAPPTSVITIISEEAQGRRNTLLILG